MNRHYIHSSDIFQLAKSVQPRACAEQRHGDPGAVLAARNLQEGRSFLGGRVLSSLPFFLSPLLSSYLLFSSLLFSSLLFSSLLFSLETFGACLSRVHLRKVNFYLKASCSSFERSTCCVRHLSVLRSVFVILSFYVVIYAFL